MEAPARVAQQTLHQPTNQPTNPALARWSLPVIHLFVQSNSESKYPCTLLIEDRQTLKPLKKICRGLGPTGAHPPSTALPLAPTHIECGRNIPKQVQVAPGVGWRRDWFTVSTRFKTRCLNFFQIFPANVFKTHTTFYSLVCCY